VSAESGGESALVLGPAIPASETTDCLDLFDVSGAASVLHVDYVRSPEWRLRQWSSADRPQLERLGILRVGWRGNAVRPVERLGSTLDVDVDVRTVEEPGNLTGVGLRLIQLLERLADGPGSTVVCVHSLSVMLQFVSLARLAKFIPACNEQFERFGARGHFHLDPDAHDDETVERLRGCFTPTDETALRRSTVSLEA